MQHTRTPPSFSMLIVDALQPQDRLHTQLLRWSMWYWRIVESMTIWTFFLLVLNIPRSTKKRFEICSIRKLRHCCSGCESIIVCSDDINTREHYWIRSTPHTVTLSDLIGVESRLNILIVFGGVSKVAVHLDYDVLYVDVYLTRTDRIIV